MVGFRSVGLLATIRLFPVILDRGAVLLVGEAGLAGRDEVRDLDG